MSRILLFCGTDLACQHPQEEIFAPVVCAMPFMDLDEVRPGGGVDPRVSKAHRIAAELRAGSVWINCYNIFGAPLRRI
jgi:phenylacetaldehyde dehydrogenase